MSVDVDSPGHRPMLGRFTQEDPIGFAGGQNLYAFAGNNPATYTDPFGLCPDDAGGDGATSDFSDCPEGTSGWYAYRLATGEGDEFWNDLGGLFAALWEGLNTDTCPECLRGIPISGYTRHGLNQVIGRGGHGVSPRAILDAVRNPERIRNMANGSVQYIGRNATVALNELQEIVTAWARNRSGWR